MAANLGGLRCGDVGVGGDSLHGASVGDVARCGKNVRHIHLSECRMRRAVAKLDRDDGGGHRSSGECIPLRRLSFELGRRLGRELRSRLRCDPGCSPGLAQHTRDCIAHPRCNLCLAGQVVRTLVQAGLRRILHRLTLAGVLRLHDGIGTGHIGRHNAGRAAIRQAIRRRWGLAVRQRIEIPVAGQIGLGLLAGQAACVPWSQQDGEVLRLLRAGQA